MSKHDMKVDIVFNGATISQDLSAELYIEGSEELTRHLNEISGHIAYWGKLVAEAAKLHRQAETDFDVWLAKEKYEVVKGGGKFGSETSKEEAVICAKTVEYLKYRKTVEDAVYHVDLLKSVADSFKSKQEMLISIGAQVRREMEISGGLTIKKPGAYAPI